jgi:hypothetical protein
VIEMGFRPPLTKAELREIGIRKNPEDVICLLWEIKRLRAIVLRIDQLQRCLTVGGGPGVLLDGIRNELAVEPCVAEQVRLDPDYN